MTNNTQKTHKLQLLDTVSALLDGCADNHEQIKAGLCGAVASCSVEKEDVRAHVEAVINHISQKAQQQHKQYFAAALLRFLLQQQEHAEFSKTLLQLKDAFDLDEPASAELFALVTDCADIPEISNLRVLSALEVELTKASTFVSDKDIFALEKALGTICPDCFSHQTVSYVYFTYLRRKNKMEMFGQQFRKYCAGTTSPLLQSLVAHSEWEKSRKDFINRLSLTADDIKVGDCTNGTLSTYAATIAEYFETETGTDEKTWDTLYSFGLRCINQAIENAQIKPYAKYFFQKSRLLMLKYQKENDLELYNQAKASILQAQRHQSIDSPEDAVTLAKYDCYAAKFDVLKMQHEVNEQKKEFDEIKKNNMKVLSLFIAIATFILKAITMDYGTLSYPQIAFSYILLLGIVVLIYAVLDGVVLKEMFTRSPDSGKMHIKLSTLILIVVGIALVVVAIALPVSLGL